MKLSEAILLGSVGTKQGFGQLRNASGATCALGAAFEAYGVKLGRDIAEVQSENYFVLLANDYPTHIPLAWRWAFVPNGRQYLCLECDIVAYTVNLAITHRNDYHAWSRPRIAAWVAELEERENVYGNLDTGTTTAAKCDDESSYVTIVEGQEELSLQ